MRVATLFACNVVVFPLFSPLNCGATKMRLLPVTSDILESIISQSTPPLPTTLISHSLRVRGYVHCVKFLWTSYFLSVVKPPNAEIVSVSNLRPDFYSASIGGDCGQPLLHLVKDLVRHLLGPQPRAGAGPFDD